MHMWVRRRQIEHVHVHESRCVWDDGQANNAYVFPAIGMAAVLTCASAITDDVFLTAAEALAHMTSIQARRLMLRAPSCAGHQLVAAGMVCSSHLLSGEYSLVQCKPSSLSCETLILHIASWFRISPKPTHYPIYPI